MSGRACSRSSSSSRTMTRFVTMFYCFNGRLLFTFSTKCNKGMVASNDRSDIPWSNARDNMSRRHIRLRTNGSYESKSRLTSDKGRTASGDKRYSILIRVFFNVLRFNFVSRTRISRTTINRLMSSKASRPTNRVMVSGDARINSRNNRRRCRVSIRLFISYHFMNYQEGSCFK